MKNTFFCHESGRRKLKIRRNYEKEEKSKESNAAGKIFK